MRAIPGRLIERQLLLQMAGHDLLMASAAVPTCMVPQRALATFPAPVLQAGDDRVATALEVLEAPCAWIAEVCNAHGKVARGSTETGAQIEEY
jgi:hypothetical protein